MQRHYVYGTVRDTRRSAIYAIRVKDDAIDPVEADEIAERMREKMLARGDVQRRHRLDADRAGLGRTRR